MLLVHRQMRMLAGPHPDLDDLAQTALEQILRARFEGRSKFSTFTQSVCYRVWMKHLRWTYRFRARFRAAEPREELTVTDQADSVSSVLEERERYQRLHDALARVSPKRRAVVLLHDLGGLAIDEIAGVVDAKPATVRTRLRDGRTRLGQLLREDPYFGDENIAREMGQEERP